jgi:hypothetical protein
MVDWLVHLWQFPYVRWHFFFTFLPSLVVWSIWGQYLLKYKKTLLYVTVLALLYGIPADIFASPVLNIWVFGSHPHVGPFIAGLPLGEYIFILFTPQLIVSVLLLVRRKLYGKV